jgi:hypothetical protein
MVKKCSKCEIEKKYSEFYKGKKAKDGLHRWCKCCVKKYYQDNKERVIKYSKQYYQDNRELRAEWENQYTKKRRKTDPLFKMMGNLRSRTYSAFKCNGYRKNTKTQQMLGVSWEVCKAHIGNQFTKGMNWDNYGEWHIDHVIPLASANTEKELTKLCHYSNLQPLWAEDNLSKGSKIESQQMKLTI